METREYYFKGIASEKLMAAYTARHLSFFLRENNLPVDGGITFSFRVIKKGYQMNRVRLKYNGEVIVYVDVYKLLVKWLEPNVDTVASMVNDQEIKNLLKNPKDIARVPAFLRQRYRSLYETFIKLAILDLKKRLSKIMKITESGWAKPGSGYPRFPQPEIVDYDKVFE